eukprot:8066825-Pyramimonas_sp.AAC.1
MTDIRKRLGVSLAAPTRGRRLTSLLALRAGDADPAIQMPSASLDQWLTTWRGRPELRPGVRQARRQVVQQMLSVPEAQRSRHA